MQPRSGATLGGSRVTITGTGFLEEAEVRFGGLLADGVTVVSDQEITALTPGNRAPASWTSRSATRTNSWAVLRLGFEYQ